MWQHKEEGLTGHLQLLNTSTSERKMSQDITIETAPHTVADAFLEALAEVDCSLLSLRSGLTLTGWRRLPLHRSWVGSSQHY